MVYFTQELRILELIVFSSLSGLYQNRFRKKCAVLYSIKTGINHLIIISLLNSEIIFHYMLSLSLSPVLPPLTSPPSLKYRNYEYEK